MKTRIHQITLVALFGAAFTLTQQAGAQALSTWSGAVGDQNWSTAGNWTPTGGGSAPPAATDTVVFGTGAFPASTNAAGSVDSIVDTTRAIGGLQYINTSATTSFHTTQLNPGVTLTLNGLFTAGVAGQTTVAGMSGTGNFTVNNITGNFNVGGGGISTAPVTFALADGTNTINVKTLSMSESGSNNGRPCTLNLGAGPTFINADVCNLGTGKGQLTTITWPNPAHTNSLRVRASDGIGRTMITNGWGFSASGSPNGRWLLSGHPVDILAGAVLMGKISGSDTATCGANITYNNGILDATTIIMGDLSTTIATGGGNVNPAILSVGGSTNTATLIVNSPTGPGGGSFTIGDSLTNHNAICFFNIGSGGVAQIYCSIVKAQSPFPANNIVTIGITNGTLNMEAATNTVGIPAFPIDTINLNSATLQLYESGSSLNMAATTLNLANTNVFAIGALPVISSLPAVIPVITYTNVTTDGNPSNLVLNPLPGGYTGYLTNDNTSPGTISLVITNGAITTKADAWGGAQNNNWDTTSFNWTNANIVVKYAEGDFVTFNDGGKTNNVNLTGARTPGSLLVTNNSLNYTFSGPGSINGLISLIKSGTGSLTLTESGGDNFATGIRVHGGALILDNPNSSISGGLTNDAGTVVQIGNNDGAGALPAGNLDNEGTLVFSRTNSVLLGVGINGGGALTQSGSGKLTLNAANTYTGSTTVSAGTLAFGAAGTFTSPLVSVRNATLDLSTATSQTTFNTVALTNGTLTIGSNTTALSFSSLAVSNSSIVLDTSVGVSATLAATSFNVGGTTNIINVTSVQNLTLTPTLPSIIPLLTYGSLSGSPNFGLIVPAGISGYISNDDGALTIELVITNAPQTIVWNGGSSTGNNWSDPANWTGTAINALDALTFDGSVRTNNNNNTTAGTLYSGITFNGSAGSFALSGNSVNLAGTMLNNSPIEQTINLGLTITNDATLDGGSGGGSLTIKGGITNTSASNVTLSNLNNGTMNDLWQSTNGGLLEVLVGSGGTWTIVDGTGSGALVQAGRARLHVNPSATGELDFGTSNSAPNVDLGFTTNGSLAIDGATSGTFAMNNGTLRVNSVTCSPSGTQHAFLNMNGGTLIVGSGGFVNGGGNGASTLTAIITNGSIYVTNGGNFTLTQRSPANINQSGGLVQLGGMVLATGQTIGGNGVYTLSGGMLSATGISVGTSGANAWGLMNYNGGTLKSGASSSAFFTQNNFAPLTNAVQAGGAVIDTAGFNVTFNSPLINDPALGGGPDGGLTKLGAGTLTLSAGSTYNGPTTVSNGKLVTSTMATGLGNYAVTNGSTLAVQVSGVGAQLTMNNLALGNGLSDTSTLQVDTLATGNPTAAPVNVTGAVTTNGTVNVALTGTSLSAGTFPLIAYTGTTFSGGLHFTPPAGFGGSLSDNGVNLVSVTLTTVTGPTTNATITKVTLSGTNLLVHGTNNNVPNTSFHYVVLTTANLTNALTNWTSVITNSFNPDGTFDYTNPIVPSQPRQFLDVKAVP